MHFLGSDDAVTFHAYLSRHQLDQLAAVLGAQG
jgi:hypothetical protein